MFVDLQIIQLYTNKIRFVKCYLEFYHKKEKGNIQNFFFVNITKSLVVAYPFFKQLATAFVIKTMV